MVARVKHPQQNPDRSEANHTITVLQGCFCRDFLRFVRARSTTIFSVRAETATTASYLIPGSSVRSREPRCLLFVVIENRLPQRCFRRGSHLLMA